MDGFFRGAMAVAVGYVLAFVVADTNGILRTSFVVYAIGASGVLAAAAGIRAFPGTLRLISGAASTAGFVLLGVIGFPVTLWLLLGAILVGAGTMSLFELRRVNVPGERRAR